MVKVNENKEYLISGRIDSSNAANFETELMELINDDAKEVVLSADELEYISSAGLRVLMKLCKKYEKVVLKDVSLEVYDILDMTGFTELLTVKKKLKFIDVSGLQFIGKGGAGAIYKYTDDSILKTFFDETNDDRIKDILRGSRGAFVKGLPTAIPFETVMTSEGIGVIYELIVSDSLAGYLNGNAEDFGEMAHKFADLAKLLAVTEVDTDTLPNVRTKFIGALDKFAGKIPQEWIDAYEKAVSLVPDSNTAVHGDFHARNIMLQDKELLLIDMDDFGYGHPIWELAGIYNAYPGFLNSNPGDERFMQLMGITTDEGKRLWDIFVADYFDGLSDEDKMTRLKLTAMYGSIRTANLMGKQLPADVSQDDPLFQRGLYVIKMVMDNLIIPCLPLAEEAFKTWTK